MDISSGKNNNLEKEAEEGIHPLQLHRRVCHHMVLRGQHQPETPVVYSCSSYSY